MKSLDGPSRSLDESFDRPRTKLGTRPLDTLGTRPRIRLVTKPLDRLLDTLGTKPGARSGLDGQASVGTEELDISYGPLINPQSEAARLRDGSMTTTVPAIWETSSPTRVLLTGVGCPGAANIITALHTYNYYIVGTDIDRYASGSLLCNSFHHILPGDHPNFGALLLEIIDREKIDVVFPQITHELVAWAKLKLILRAADIPVLIGPRAGIELCLDKGETYRMAESLGIPTVPYFVSTGMVYKPTQGKESRGVGNVYCDSPTVFMEYIEGDETSVDALCREGEVLAHFCRKRTHLRGGLHYRHKVIDGADLVQFASRIISHLNWDWFINIQFKGGYLMEVNPRISTQVVWGEYNLPHLGLQLALGNITPESITALTPLPLGLRTHYYHSQFTWNPLTGPSTGSGQSLRREHSAERSDEVENVP